MSIGESLSPTGSIVTTRLMMLIVARTTVAVLVQDRQRKILGWAFALYHLDEIISRAWSP